MDQFKVGNKEANFDTDLFQSSEKGQDREAGTARVVNDQAMGSVAVNGIFSTSADTPETDQGMMSEMAPGMTSGTASEAKASGIAPEVTRWASEGVEAEIMPRAANNLIEKPVEASQNDMHSVEAEDNPALLSEIDRPDSEMATPQAIEMQPLSIDGSTEEKRQKMSLGIDGEIIDKGSEKKLREVITQLSKKPFELNNYRDEAMAESLLSNFGRMFGNDDIGEIQAEEAARAVDQKILEERNK